MEKKAAIRVQNCYSWLNTNCDSTRNILWKALRFREKGYFHSRLYKQKIWDGFTDFFTKKNGKFLTGLLPEVELALKHLGVKYKLVDERTITNFAFNSIDENFLNQWNDSDKPYVLHDYQADLTNQSIKYRRGIVKAPTAAGKTAIMISILKCLPPKTPTLILCRQKSLVEQNYNELVQWKFENVGRLYDKYKEPNIITCATVQSLHKIESLLPHIKAIIVDEVHLMMTKVSKKFYNKLVNCDVRIGVSATPFKFGGKDQCQKYSVKGYFGPVFKIKSTAAENGVLSTKKLQERGQLSYADCVFYPIVQPENIELDMYQDAVQNGISENIYFHNVIKRLVTEKLRGRSLILVERISHGDYLKSILPNSLWIRGEDSLEVRNEVLEQLRHSKEDVTAIATHQILNAGINFFIHNLINAAGGKADHTIVQRFGRGLRPANDKEMLKYFDFVYKTNEYLEDHSNKRIKTLKKEGHKVDVREELDF